LVPAPALSYSRTGSVIVPRWLDASDHGWIRLVVAEYERHVGGVRRLLDEALAGPKSFDCPRRKLAVVRRVLDDHWSSRVAAPLPPHELRARLFAAAAASASPADQTIAAVARELSLSPAELAAGMFADLPSERCVCAPAEPPSVPHLALAANLRIAQALLARSTGVMVGLVGNARAVVRLAKLRGLICELTSQAASPGSAAVPRPEPELPCSRDAPPSRRLPWQRHAPSPSLRLSGPLSLFRHTTLYGRAMGALIPILGHCHDYELHADLLLPDGPGTLTLTPRDPLPRSGAPAVYDSSLERTLAKDLAKVAPDWDVVREPEPVAACGTLVFPDFALVNRRTAQRVLVEVAGFWTASYLREKLSRLAAARRCDLVVCVDRRGDVGETALPASLPVLPFTRRVDALALMRFIEQRRLGRRAS
jgi:predicted nuclease of restriction endonuclease-like RecB superfamily